jgi:AdoMet-dependent rRNA methyltransferase SPB1
MLSQRAAFKLIQLNKKYGFLERSKVLIDLCAAPGSWCQVASEVMPQGSLIVGVDLSPIKTIPRCITFQSDITTDKCRATIRSHLKTWKADTVLHDGAPNVGTAWVQDAFSQAELVLQSMKLATEFLAPGGNFVTKVFRSKDYNALLWVFNQLFDKVESTKPPSSRNVSAEIFVVCRGYKAPKRLDPKFLDPRSVFAETQPINENNEAKVFNPEVKKRKREGYDPDNQLQYKEAPASEFIQTTDPIAMLGTYNKLHFRQGTNGDIALAALDKLPETTLDIRKNCEDLKVLGRKEFRQLLKWRLKAREIFGFATKKQKQETEQEEVAEIEPMDEELRMQEDMQRVLEKASSRKKRERRRENEKKQKEIVRLQMHMQTPTEIGLEQTGPNGEDTMFDLKRVDRAGAVDQFSKGRMAMPIAPQPQEASDSEDSETDDEADNLDRELDSMYEMYQERKSESDAKYRAKRSRKESADGDWEGFSDKENSDSEGFEEDKASEGDSSDEEDGPQSRQLVHGASDLTRKAATFFAQDIFKDIDGLESDSEKDDASGVDVDRDPEPTKLPSRQKVEKKAAEEDQELEISEGEAEEADEGEEWEADESDGEEEEEEEEMEDDDAFEMVKNNSSDWDKQGEVRQDGKLDIDIITAEAMTLAHQVATGKKTVRDLEDDNFNKLSLRDTDGMPEWFLDDEKKHSKPHRPITAAAAAAIKEKTRVMNARPIKKVREAKDRKKFKAAQRLEKLRKKSALLADEEGMTEKDKAQSISKLMSKAAKKKPKQQVKLVVARGQNRGISGRPKGTKGKYKIVDARLKKDVRAEKRLAKKRK